MERLVLLIPKIKAQIDTIFNTPVNFKNFWTEEGVITIARYPNESPKDKSIEIIQHQRNKSEYEIITVGYTYKVEYQSFLSQYVDVQNLAP